MCFFSFVSFPNHRKHFMDHFKDRKNYTITRMYLQCFRRYNGAVISKKNKNLNATDLVWIFLPLYRIVVKYTTLILCEILRGNYAVISKFKKKKLTFANIVFIFRFAVISMSRYIYGNTVPLRTYVFQLLSEYSLLSDRSSVSGRNFKKKLDFGAKC